MAMTVMERRKKTSWCNENIMYMNSCLHTELMRHFRIRKFRMLWWCDLNKRPSYFILFLFLCSSFNLSFRKMWRRSPTSIVQLLLWRFHANVSDDRKQYKGFHCCVRPCLWLSLCVCVCVRNGHADSQLQSIRTISLWWCIYRGIMNHYSHLVWKLFKFIKDGYFVW